MLWENAFINRKLTLFYSIRIPLASFNSGHDYLEQPTETMLVIDWIQFSDDPARQQEKNWKNLVGRQFSVSYESNTAEGSVYLGYEHCQFNTEVKFLSRQGTTFDIELQLAIDFNIDTINLDADGLVKLRCQVDFDGLRIYHTQLPTYQQAPDKLSLISKFIDLDAYQTTLTQFDNKNVDWKHLKALP